MTGFVLMLKRLAGTQLKIMVANSCATDPGEQFFDYSLIILPTQWLIDTAHRYSFVYSCVKVRGTMHYPPNCC